VRLSLLSARLNSARGWLTRRAPPKGRIESRAMPGWDSPETVAAALAALQLAGLIGFAVLAALAAFAASRRGAWPEWFDIGEYQLRSRFVAVGGAAALVLLLAVQALAYGYGRRQDDLVAEALKSSAAQIVKLGREVQARRLETPSHYLKENSDLRQKLIDAENKLAALERSQIHKRLTSEQKRFLIEALRPFAGQQVSIASIRGDAEGEMLAQDFVSVLDAAGWDHHGKAGVSTQQWDRDPVGIEVALNEDDARSGQISAGVGALINSVRQLGLVYDGTIYMDNEVPAGQALIKVGKKLQN
jgi:hypothetical protein